MTRHEYVERVIEPRIQRENELYHHGILGMKWGVRRYQNEDGSLTPEGRKRYLTGSGLTGNAKREIISAATKAIRKTNDPWNIQEDDEAELDRVGKIIKSAMPESVQEEMNKKYNNWINAMSNEYDFENSEEGKKANNETFNTVIKMIKNDPEWYPDEYAVLNDTKLSDDDKIAKLTNMKRFNNAYDTAYEDIYERYEKEYSKRNKRQNPDKLMYDYVDYKSEAINNVLGKDASKNIPYIMNHTYGHTNENIKLGTFINTYVK